MPQGSEELALLEGTWPRCLPLRWLTAHALFHFTFPLCEGKRVPSLPRGQGPGWVDGFGPSAVVRGASGKSALACCVLVSSPAVTLLICMKTLCQAIVNGDR